MTSEKTKLLYTIDIEADLIRRIDFNVNNAGAGSLEFEYLPDANLKSSEFTAPVRRNERVTLDRDPGMLWLVQLANGVLGR